MKQSVICFFALLCGHIAYTQKYRIESLTVADGLSQGFVLSLLQDSRGFIWIGTSNGLNRYDGYQIKRFTNDPTSPWGLQASVIYCMAEDAQGLLWMGTEKGLVVMDPYSERFFHLTNTYRSFSSGSLERVTIKGGGRVWFCYHSPTEGEIFVVKPPAELTRLLREGRIQSSDFGVQTIALGAGVSSPTWWLPTANDTVIAATNRQRQFCKINLSTLRVEIADPRTLDYQRWGNYGLVYAGQGARGFLFPLQEVARDQPDYGFLFREFLQPPGEMPLFYQSTAPTIYQLDTAVNRLKTPGWKDSAPPTQFKPFIQLDKPISYGGIVDQAGNMWMATNGYGVRKISRSKLDFQLHLSGTSFYNFALLPDGRIWPGLYQPYQVLHLRTNHLEEAPWTAELTKETRPHGLLIARSGDWWMAAVRNDRLLLLTKGPLNQPWKELPIELKFFSNFQIPLLEDRRGNIWMAGQGEIVRIRPDNHQVDRWPIASSFPATWSNELRGICWAEDAQGRLWMGLDGGLVRVENPDGEPVFRTWYNHADEPPLFKNAYLLSVYPDPTNPRLVWVGTRGGGLVCLDSQTETAETFTEKDGLANNVVYGILPDAFGYLWLSTNRGLSRFHPGKRTFSNFPSTEPKLNVEFNTGAYRVMPSGELAFGSVEGLFFIRPLAEQPVVRPCVVEITQIKINGTALDPSVVDATLLFNAQNEVSLRLPFDQDNIVLEFAAPQTGDPASVQYRYRMLGLDEHWISTGHQRTVNLVAIPPGEYTIELQSIGANSDWAEAPTTRVQLQIRPPWYRSWSAWGLYAGLAALLLYLYVWYERRRLRLKYEVNSSRKEMERLQSLDEFKNRFFGYISHEFKTPLTIILGQGKRLLARQTLPDEGKDVLAILQQGQNMLEMVDQMVDITRLSNHELRLNWRNGNFSDYTRYLVESLRPLAEFKSIHLDFQTTTPNLPMDFDPLRWKYIIHNLVSNAVQHTPVGGRIEVSIHPGGPNQVQISVSDTGEGIALEDLPNIFDRYYQGRSPHPQPHHFGLGLAFVKDLLQLFGGTVVVSSQLGSGTVFTITLPVTQQALPLAAPWPDLSGLQNHFNRPITPSKSPKKSLPWLLVVEDNPFVSDFLRSALDAHFQLEFATDGLTGHKKALDIIPDLILTDVMMTGLNGYELTRRLKSHELTGHIPIVMLSARSGLSDRLTGQQLGADAYLGKPFDEQELILVLQNLHHLQGRWRARYAGLATQASPANGLGKEMLEQPAETVRQTDAFMLKMYALFAEHYTDEGYDHDQLCHDMEISKTQLHRKFAALSDQSPMQLLRRYRLQKAYDLLSENPAANIKEICFQVGFNNPSHFSRLFSKTFQMAPSEVKKASAVG